MKPADTSIIHVCAWSYALWHFRRPLLAWHRDTFRRTTIYVNEHEFVGQKGHLDGLRNEGFELKLAPVTQLPSPRVAVEILRLAHYLRLEHYDVLMAHQPMGALVGIPAAALARIPFRIYSTGGLRYQPGRKDLVSRVLEMGEASIVALAHAVFSVNKEDRDYLETTWFGRGKAHYVGPRGGCGIDNGAFSPQVREECRNPGRLELELPEDITAIAYVGRIVWRKGLKNLIDATAHVRKRAPHHRFAVLLIGSGEEEGEIREYVRELGLEDRYRFLGYRPEVEKTLSAADLFVLPSDREGMPTSLLEAMNLGVPCVATKIRGAREIIEHLQNGYLVPPSDSSSLADAIISAMDRPEWARKLGLRGHRTLTEEYSTEACLPRTQALFEQLIAPL